MIGNHKDFSFLEYLAQTENPNGDAQLVRLPSLDDLSAETGVGVPKLREQVQVARALGLIEVRPRTGMRRLPYSFTPAVRQSLGYALALDRAHFEEFSDLRKHVEEAYWFEAVEQLTEEDKAELLILMENAWKKLGSEPPVIPHAEHRQLHMLVFRHLENPFVLGILEAYWEAYEAVGLNVYFSYKYMQQVWTYHQRMVDEILAGDNQAAFQILSEHTALISELIHNRLPES